MGVTMLFQARMAPPSPGMDPKAQKMMRYMPLFFLVILYNYSAGLTLYWTVQNLLTIVQTKLTKAKEEPGQAASASPIRPSPRPAAPAAALRRRK
jgi:YidC/Oxa1 family membrane protein insertase